MSVKGSRHPTRLSTCDREVGKDATFLVVVSRVGFEALQGDEVEENMEPTTTSLRCSCKPLPLAPSLTIIFEGSPLCPTPYIHSELKKIVYAVHDMYFSGITLYILFIIIIIMLCYMDPHQSHDGLFP